MRRTEWIIIDLVECVLEFRSYHFLGQKKKKEVTTFIYNNYIYTFLFFYKKKMVYQISRAGTQSHIFTPTGRNYSLI